MPSQQENKGSKERRKNKCRGVLWVGGGEKQISEVHTTHTHKHTQKTRCFLTTWCDGRHPLTNKSELVKWQDAEKGIWNDDAPALWAAERRGMSGMWREMLSHTGGERRACPNLVYLMKNRQESAYSACPSHRSTAPSFNFLLLLRPTLPLLYSQPSCPLFFFNTLWSLLSPQSPLYSQKSAS